MSKTAEELSQQPASATSFALEVSEHGVGSLSLTSDPGRMAFGVPQMIPEDELLYWTPEWRRLESESLKELKARTQSREFANFKEFANWLLDADED